MADRKILIDVSGGLVQEVFVTGDNDVKIVLVDWDIIREGDIDTSPWSEWNPDVLTPAEFEAKLKDAEEEHAAKRTCHYCNTSLLKDGKIVHNEAECPKLLWKQNELQFPRLLAEIHAMGLNETQMLILGRSMDLEPEQIKELFDRADANVEERKALESEDG